MKLWLDVLFGIWSMKIPHPCYWSAPKLEGCATQSLIRKNHLPSPSGVKVTQSSTTCGLWGLCDPIAHQAPLFMGFSRQEHWSGQPFPSPGDLPDPRIEPVSPTLQADSLPSEPPGRPQIQTQPPSSMSQSSSPQITFQPEHFPVGTREFLSWSTS